MQRPSLRKTLTYIGATLLPILFSYITFYDQYKNKLNMDHITLDSLRPLFAVLTVLSMVIPAWLGYNHLLRRLESQQRESQSLSNRLVALNEAEAVRDQAVRQIQDRMDTVEERTQSLENKTVKAFMDTNETNKRIQETLARLHSGR